jgi:hypothetical protein
MAEQLGVQWELANSYGIAIDEANNVWHAGHVTDLVELEGGDSGLLVATETGGVWTISPNGTALPMSNGWDKPNINCVALGPDHERHAYAGTDGVELDGAVIDDGLIYETDITTAIPLLNWKPIDQPLPPGAGHVKQVLILRRHRLIVAACSGGIYWSEIPKAEVAARGCLGIFFPAPKPKPRPPYVWRRAEEDDHGQAGYYGAAVGSIGGRTERPGEEDLRYVSIVAGGNRSGIFVGQWDANTVLRMRRAVALDDQGNDMTPWYFGLLAATSVASCETRPNHLYSVSSNPDGTMRFVMHSRDGGRRWTPCGDDLRGSSGGMRASAGDQGANWNNCIGVMPSGPGVVAVGWQMGTFLSVNEGKSWMQILNSPHLHADVHVTRFKPTTADDEHFLYIGSDGGLAQVKTDDVLAGIVPPWCRSDYNRQFPNLQCYATLVSRQFYGTLATSPTDPGLVSSGVHDNGNLAAFTGPGATPWRQLAGGDGGWNGIVADGGLVHNIMGSPVQAHRHIGNSYIPLGVPAITMPTPANAQGLIAPVADVVRRPSFRNAAGDTMVAVGASGSGTAGQQPGIYGLFVDRQNPLLYHWERLGGLAPDVAIGAVASASGATIFVGAANSRILAFDSAQGTAIETPIKLPKPYPNAVQSGGVVTRIVALPDQSAFALLNIVTFSPPTADPAAPVIGSYPPPSRMSYVLRLDGLQWVATAWTPTMAVTEVDSYLYGIDVATHTRPHAVFVATDNQVYGSIDGGDTWKLASSGLPMRPHNAELRVGRGPGREAGWLYLSTFGRSVWRAHMGRFQG